MNIFNELRQKYPEFKYKSFMINRNKNTFEITYVFEIPNLVTFTPKLEITLDHIINNNESYINTLAFHIGLIELISYVKVVCSPKIIIEAGYIGNSEITWLKKLYYNGLGEFLYKNNITITEEALFNIICNQPQQKLPDISYQGNGNLIPVGGGKDSVVTLEILKREFIDNDCFIINPKTPSLNCAQIAGYDNTKIITVKRTIDPKLLDLNKQGYLNGHTPFSAIVAFISYLVAYLTNKKYIVLSNESSANESTVLGTSINHQYSKTYEFEQDFNHYMHDVIHLDITYFSLLRPLSEYQIGMIFSNYSKYHPVFRSCNLGSKKENWPWCCECPKCLFVYTILSPFLYKEKLIKIFGEDLFTKKELLKTFIEILGYSDTKPFECVGTYEEARYAVYQTINHLKDEQLPYLLQYYKDNYYQKLNFTLENNYNQENNLSDNFATMVREELNKCTKK